MGAGVEETLKEVTGSLTSPVVFDTRDVMYEHALSLHANPNHESVSEAVKSRIKCETADFQFSCFESDENEISVIHVETAAAAVVSASSISQTFRQERA